MEEALVITVSLIMPLVLAVVASVDHLTIVIVVVLAIKA